MATRGIGAGQARAVAAAASLPDGISMLAGSAYGRFVRPGMELAASQRAVAETALWHVRVLAGWMPPRALEPVRALAAWFELANIEDRLAYLAGAHVGQPFVLGGLATGWPAIAGAQTAAELRQVLAGSPWGDPGAEDRVTVGLFLRFSWARRVIESVPEAVAWAAGAVALLLARELFLAGRSADDLSALRPPGVGRGWRLAHDVRSLRESLPADAAWALAEANVASELWRCEAAWWRRVEHGAAVLAHDPQLGRSAVIGSIGLLGADAWRASAALGSAARRATVAYDEIA